MQEKTINIKWLFLILVIYAIIYIIGYTSLLNFNTLIWFVLFLIAYKFFDRKTRVKSKIEKIQMIFISILIYFIIYYFSGLIVGFSKSPYAHDFISIMKNLWHYVVIIFFQEYVRAVITSNEKKNYAFLILVVLIFSIFEINIVSLLNNIDTFETIFKYSFSNIAVIFARNILLTYLSIKGGLRVTLIYRMPLMFVNIIAPIFPAYDWFMNALSGLLLPFVVYVVFNYFDNLKTSRESKRSIRKQNPLKKSPVIIIALIIVAFVAGVFKYMPVAIMSNSMATLIKRGDAVIVEKLNKEEIKYLQVNDIIEYKLSGTIIVHRIIEIEKDNEGNLLFTTKGDNNQRKDEKKVSEEQVVGKVYLKIPKVGFPSVWLSELFTKETPDVELGK